MDYDYINRILLFLFILFGLSCKEQIKEKKSEEVLKEASIDTLFLQFDISLFEKNREDHSYTFQTPDSLFSIIQGERILEKGFYQIVYSLKDSLFYDEYFYFPNGRLQQTCRYIRYHHTLSDACYEFNTEGEMISFIEYEKSKILDLPYIISFTREHGFNFFSPEVSFYIIYKKKEEFSGDNIIYIKHSNPIWCITMTNENQTIRFIRINAQTGNIETDCFWNGNTMICKEGSEEDLWD